MTSSSLKGYLRLFRPLIDVLKELGGSGRPSEVANLVAKNLGLSDEELDEKIKSGTPKFNSELQWARYYLVQAGCLSSSKHGVWTLSEAGWKSELSDETIKNIRREVWKKDAEKRKASLTETPDEEVESEDRPDGPSKDYRIELLENLRNLPPGGFERLCQRLFRESGFQQVTVTGKSGDGGIDGHGILQVNPFVSFQVYFQCKRYSGSVGSGAIRDFRGAMIGRADKGIIITTGSFTSDARKEAVRDGVPPIELVDADELVDLFEKLELGLNPVSTFDVDDTFFDEFRV